MVRRSLGAFLWSLAGLLACSLGALSALVGTGAGRTLLSAVLRESVGKAVDGRIEVGDVSGSLLAGVTLTDVKLYDPDSTLVAWLPRAEVDYNVFDLIAGQVVLQDVTLDHPYISLVQHRGGRLNLEELLRLGVPHQGPGGGPAALVLLRNVAITDGTVVLRLQARPAPGDDAREIDEFGHDGRRRVRRLEHLDARLAALRLSSPRERGVRADISALAVTLNDPAVRVTDMRGRITIVGDSLEADLARVRFPRSQLALKGRLRWPRDTVLYDLAVRADSAYLADLHFIDPKFPEGAMLRGAADVRSHGGRVLEVRLDPLDVMYHGGRLTGRLTALSVADSGIVALREADVEAEDLDLMLAHAFLDTLPFYGHLSGHTTADGPLDSLALQVSWQFRDSLVPGWPVSHVQGRGAVGLGGGVAFLPFAVEAADVDLGTVRRLVPAAALQGRLEAAGTLGGSLEELQFSGTLRQRDGTRPASQVSGTVRLDSRTDTLGVVADLVADSLSFDGLRGSFPNLPLAGSASGPIRLGGSTAALTLHADLIGSGGSGRAQVDAVLGLLDARFEARDLSIQGTGVDVHRWLGQGPPSRLTFTVRGSVGADSGEAPAGALAATLSSSIVAGSPVDSGRAGVRFADRRVIVDSLRVFQPGLRTTGQGALGWRRPDRDSLVVEFDADSLSAIDSLGRWLAGPRLARASPGETLRGAARVRLTLAGALDSVAVAARGTVERLRAGRVRIPAASGAGRFEPGPVPALALEAAFDSIAVGEMGFGAAAARLRGTRDSLTWFARSRLGDLGAFIAGGRLARATTTAGGAVADPLAVGIDSLALLLPNGVWMLQHPVEVRSTDSALTVTPVSLTSPDGKGRLDLRGELPASGRVSANLQLEGFPMGGVYALLQKDTIGVGGTLTATVAMAGTRAAPLYTGSFALNDGQFGDFRAPYLDGTLEYRERRLDAGMHLWRSGQQILTVTAHLPLDLALTAVERRQIPDTISVRAVGNQVDLSVLEAATPLLRQVNGSFTADLAVRGTWDTPRLEGSLSIDTAAATIPALNVRYERIQGRFALSGDTIRVADLSAFSGKGRARVTGFVRLAELTHPILGLDIDADDFKALEIRGYLSLTASGQLALRGPVFGATLTGRGTVPSGVLYFADLVNKRVVNLDQPDPWIAALMDTSLVGVIQRQGLGPAFESVFLDRLRIQDLQLAMGSDVWLRSTEANIQLTGTVTVNKEERNYRLTGTLQAPRGTYRLVVGPVTREFIVTQGTVRYFGTPDLDAALDIEAKHVVHPAVKSASDPNAGHDIPVVARIGGTLLVPKLTLSSAEHQEFSQTDLISLLIFGQSSAEQSAGAAGGNRNLVLNNAVAALSSAVSGELERKFVSDLGVPLDYFEFRPYDPTAPFSGAQLAAGWQIGRKTFLVLNGGFCQAQGGQVDVASTLGASLQFRISPEWRTEASFEPVRTCGTTASTTLSTRFQAGLDLFWEKRY
jgi:translocation and assembly module TamB